VEILTSDKELAQYFENVASEVLEKIKSGEISAQGGSASGGKSGKEKVLKLATNYIITELRRHMGEHEHSLADIKITPENYAEFVGIVADGKINSSAAQTVLAEMYKTGADPSQIILEKNLAQMDNSDELEKIIEEVLAKNEKSVTDFKAGKENALKFLMGQVMAMTKGKANPQKVQEMLRKKL
jgi:aspartyl-tRNA(Asn)/glutamyl-tRNA(Gln) amidotransferase subunit B